MNGTVNIRGKEYKTVALRVSEFREHHPDWTISSAIHLISDDCVVMVCEIRDETGRLIANGHAEEYRQASQINRTSALENCETSAIGRALACLGYGGTEFASADEVANAISQQSPLVDMNAVVRDNFEAIYELKAAIKEEDYTYAAQLTAEIGDEAMRALWVAPTKGGVFTTEERRVMKSDEFAKCKRELT